MGSFRWRSLAGNAVDDALDQGRGEFADGQIAQRLADLGWDLQQDVTGIAVVGLGLQTQALQLLAFVESLAEVAQAIAIHTAAI